MISLVKKLLSNEKKIEAALRPCDRKKPEQRPDEKKGRAYACA